MSGVNNVTAKRSHQKDRFPFPDDLEIPESALKDRKFLSSYVHIFNDPRVYKRRRMNGERTSSRFDVDLSHHNIKVVFNEPIVKRKSILANTQSTKDDSGIRKSVSFLSKITYIDAIDLDGVSSDCTDIEIDESQDKTKTKAKSSKNNKLEKKLNKETASNDKPSSKSKKKVKDKSSSSPPPSSSTSSSPPSNKNGHKTKSTQKDLFKFKITKPFRKFGRTKEKKVKHLQKKFGRRMFKAFVQVKRSFNVKTIPDKVTVPLEKITLKTKDVTPETSATETIAPETIEPETIAPETIAPETIAPETIAEETIAQETIAPETITPETIAPETMAPKTIEPEMIAPETIAPETIAPETIVPETIAAETIAAETIAAETIAAETIAAETIAAETIAPETIAPETIAPEIAPETIEPETIAPETIAPETIAPETIAPETIASETIAPETIAPETIAPETIAPETIASETIASETIAPETIAPETSAPSIQDFPIGQITEKEEASLTLVQGDTGDTDEPMTSETEIIQSTEIDKTNNSREKVNDMQSDNQVDEHEMEGIAKTNQNVAVDTSLANSDHPMEQSDHVIKINGDVALDERTGSPDEKVVSCNDTEPSPEVVQSNTLPNIIDKITCNMYYNTNKDETVTMNGQMLESTNTDSDRMELVENISTFNVSFSMPTKSLSDNILGCDTPEIASIELKLND